MTMDTYGAAHIQKRIRVHQTCEPYPHPEKSKMIIDKIVTFAGLLGPIFTIPQITGIWIDKNASGVSAIAWGAYACMAVLWVVYGVMHKAKPIVLIYGIWIVLDGLIVLGTLLYG